MERLTLRSKEQRANGRTHRYLDLALDARTYGLDAAADPAEIAARRERANAIIQSEFLDVFAADASCPGVSDLEPMKIDHSSYRPKCKTSQKFTLSNYTLVQGLHPRTSTKASGRRFYTSRLWTVGLSSCCSRRTTPEWETAHGTCMRFPPPK
jgi:hypothetical protein